MLVHHPAKFGGHRHFFCGNMMFLVVEGKDYICPRFDPPLLFMSKEHGSKAHGKSY